MVEEWGGIGCPWLRINRLLSHKIVGSRTAAKEKLESGVEEAAQPPVPNSMVVPPPPRAVVAAVPVAFSCFASTALPNSL